jgi:hypothetical protein
MEYWAVDRFLVGESRDVAVGEMPVFQIQLRRRHYIQSNGATRNTLVEVLPSGSRCSLSSTLAHIHNLLFVMELQNTA